MIGVADFPMMNMTLKTFLKGYVHQQQWQLDRGKLHFKSTVCLERMPLLQSITQVRPSHSQPASTPSLL